MHHHRHSACRREIVGHHTQCLGELLPRQAGGDRRARGRVRDGDVRRTLFQPLDHGRELAARIGERRMTGCLALALSKQRVNGALRRARVRERVLEGDRRDTLDDRATDRLRVTPQIDEHRARSPGRAPQVHLLVAERGPHFIDVVDGEHRIVEAQIGPLGQRIATRANRRGWEQRREIALGMVVGAGHAAIEPIGPARAAQVNEHDVPTVPPGRHRRQCHARLAVRGSRPSR